jgi:hypothetical protein
MPARAENSQTEASSPLAPKADASICKTPILDLLRPLPISLVDRPRNRLTYVLLSTMFVSLLLGNYPLLLFFILAWIVGVITIAVHELGHLAFGWLSGLRFESVSIVWLWIGRQNGSFRVRFRRHALAGHADMSLSSMLRARRKLFWFVAGGGIASLLLGILAIPASRLVELYCPEPIPAMWSGMAYLSLFTALLSVIPFPQGFYFSDGQMLKMLLRSVAGTEYMLASYGIGMQHRNGISELDMNQRWVKIANLKGQKHQAEYHKTWVAYAGNTDASVSDQLLEQCLSRAGLIHTETREHLVAEAAYFCAWFRKDAAKARIWRRRLKEFENLPYLTQLRVNTAISSCSDDYPGALGSCERALQFIRALPQGSRSRQLETSWSAWKQGIESLVQQKRNPPPPVCGTT